MIVCKSKEDYNLIKVLRAHGWDRNLEKKNTFNFINQGFNLRPLEVSAASLNQFKRLDKMKEIRSYNRNKIINSIKSYKDWSEQFKFFNAKTVIDPSWFGLPLIINIKNFTKINIYT